MPTSDESWSAQLRVIGDLELPDHKHLGREDRCYFFGNYTPGAGWSHSATNQTISNLKKSPLRRHLPEWQHKELAIAKIGTAIRRNLVKEAIPNMTFVPIPGSKTRSHAEFDDRMTRVARAIGGDVDVRELIVGSADRAARHITGERRDPDELRAHLAVATDLLSGTRNVLVLLDDVITTGCSFSVCKSLLQEAIPGSTVFGIFAARCLRTAPAHLGGFDF